VQRQTLWLVVGLAVMLVILAVDYHTWASLALPLYIFSVVALS